uniref:PLP-dependent transferase n=1 Tax=Stutzerimonas nitrititolerans TaxID=2482751 RepID=UPI0035E44282
MRGCSGADDSAHAPAWAPPPGTLCVHRGKASSNSRSHAEHGNDQKDRANAGIRDSLIRVAVGLEDVADLQADLARGLAAL